MSRRLRQSIAALVLIPLFLLAACGSADEGSDGGSGSGTGAGDNAAATDAKAALASEGWLDAIESIGVDEPLSAPPSAKSVAIGQCSLDICKQIASGVSAAAKKLGWSTKSYSTGATPEDTIGAYKQIVDDKPDAVVVMSVQLEVIRTELAKLKDQGAVIVGSGLDAAPEDPIDVVINAQELNAVWGAGMADYMVSETDGKLQGVYVGVPFFPYSVVLGKGLSDEVSKVCSSCGVDTMDANPQDIGRKVPQQVVSYLQANPETNYVALAFGDLGIGVPEALQAAGLADKVKIISIAGSAANYQYIEAGQQRADMALDTRLTGWYLVDAAARLTGDETPPDYDSIRTVRILTEIDWNPSSEPYVAIKDYQSQFASLWGM